MLNPSGEIEGPKAAASGLRSNCSRGSEMAVSARLRINHSQRRVGRRNARNVIDPMTTYAEGRQLDAGDELPRRTTGKGLDEQRRVDILRLIDDAVSAHCLAREPPAAALRDSLWRPALRGDAPDVERASFAGGVIDPPSVTRPGRNVLIARLRCELPRGPAIRIDDPDVPLQILIPRIERDAPPVR
jgi:hypothetical protein